MTAIRALLLSSISVVLPFANAVQAQVATDPAATSRAELEEIIVTATRRAESLQSIPIAVTALSREALETRQISDVGEIDSFTPNFNFTYASLGAGSGLGIQSSIRGIGSQDFAITFDPGVGIYVDSIYQARSIGATLDIVDVDRVEVLRGPQGTLFGKNTPGGAVSIVTRAPTDELEGRAAITVGRFDRLDLEGIINIPLVEDKLFVRFSGVMRATDGYGRSTRLPDDLSDTDRYTVRGALKWIPSDRFSATLRADYTKQDENQRLQKLIDVLPFSPTNAARGIGTAQLLWNLIVANPAVNPAPRLPIAAATLVTDPADRFVSAQSEAGYDRAESLGSSLTMDFDLSSSIVLTSITGYRELDAGYATDADGTILPLISGPLNTIDQKQFSQELLFNGRVEDRLDWTAGAYYLHEKAESHTEAFLLPDLFLTLQQAPANSVLLPIPGFPPLGGPNNPFNTFVNLSTIWDNAQKTDSYALFAQITYHLSNQLRVTGGLRWTRETKRYSITATKPLRNDFVAAAGTFEESWSALTPRASLEWTPASHFLAYASVARGFKSGGFNARPLSPGDLEAYDPEYVWTYEAGVKSDWFDRRLRLNAAMFYNDYKDIQLAVAVPQSNGSTKVFVGNAGSAEIKGVELELEVVPTSDLTLNASLGYLDNEIKKIQPGAGGVLPGNRLFRTPKWTLSLGAEQRWAINGIDFSARADWNWRSAYFNDNQNYPETRQAAYGLLSARLTAAFAGGNYSLSVFGSNLTDEEYFESLTLNQGVGLVYGQPGRPREWGITLGAKF